MPWKNLNKIWRILVIAPLLFFSIAACTKFEDTSQNSKTSFLEVDAYHSNIDFVNSIIENDSLNYFKFPYIYMGGGVAIGDLNNDGLSDVFLTGNMVSNKLYLNKGNMQFEDITITANVEGDDRWYTGVTMVDINNDGWLDIYLSVSGKFGTTQNQLLINNGDLTFTESAADFGIDDASNSIQATFFDYDLDGDLDLFVANYPLVPLSQGNLFYQSKMEENLHKESGHLYLNDGTGHFTDITRKAGVQNFGLTLGLIASDFNNDGWPDLYLSNDFNVPDYFYINNQDGTFKEVVQTATGHTSMFGMGIDASDFNNDGLIDLIQADMTPEDYVRARVNMASMNPKSFKEGVDLGFHYQYMQNSLQINNGVNTDGTPIMSEVSRMSKMASTDWSWSTLFADLDNDGWKDVYITNGMKRDVNDNDINNRSGATSFKQAFNISITDYASQPIANYAYQNQGNNTFKKVGEAWNLDLEGFSNGMSYGDLDNDGDLDLVINNIDRKATLYENKTEGSNFIRIELAGPQENLKGLGTKVILKNTNGLQTQELTLTRGFQSSVEPILHFGLGAKVVENLRVIWPDGKEQVLEKPSINKKVKIDYAQASKPVTIENKRKYTFSEITSYSGIDFNHEEDLFDDYSSEPLLPYEYAKIGPGLAKGDVNNDGLEDFFIGNATRKSGKLYIQDPNSKFTVLKGPWEQDEIQEDTGALFVDFDNDGDQDLYVVSHGNQFLDHSDRLYINTPNGFIKLDTALPKETTAGKAIAVSDYNRDGLIDIFIGGRNQPGNYPFPASSMLLKNMGGIDGEMKFSNVNSIAAKELDSIGMITDAEWADLDGDDWPELILSGEWMPITIFKNNKGKLMNNTQNYGLSKLTGWWYSVKSVDVDNDGDLDIVAGNLGLNHKYQATTDSPFEVYASDFDENGENDIVLSYNKDKKSVPLRGRECSSQQVPAIAKRFDSYRSFAGADLEEIYGKYMLQNALHYESKTFGHHWFENVGGVFAKQHLLPIQSQFSSINAIEVFAYNTDEYPDLFIAGNLYAAEAETPRSDSGLGMVLIGSPNGFKPVPSNITGLFARGDIKDVEPIQLANGMLGFLVGVNNGKPKLLQYNNNISVK
ncbi:MAG: VCBS repeat-containing protein [Flavobacteriaceae bacterium]